MQKQELLAPAGDFEAGCAALYYGADAVYLGLKNFSARATAANFDEAELGEFTVYAHSLGKKVYVALNTLLQESELDQLVKSLDICARCRVDGLIIQDLGVARVVAKEYPQLEMHASTQMAVHNKEGALFLQKLGFKRVVLARELTAAEIKEIAAIPGLETEAFIHGALCYSYSGLCLFSSMEFGRSANRGKCLYPCRGIYQCGKESGHLFSMKDMALCADVRDMPVTSLKIEGRKKSALYVAAVTDYYRRILDGKGADKAREDNIKQIFSRPWCKFHFHGKDKNVVDREFVGHRGLLAGAAEGVSHGYLRFTPSHKISRFDGIQIEISGQEKPFGFSVQKILSGKKSVFEAEAGKQAEFELPKGYPHIAKGDKIYLASSSEVKGAYRYTKPRPHEFGVKYGIDVVVKIEPGRLTAVCGDCSETAEGSFSAAENPAKTAAAVRGAFEKTGGTEFELHSLKIENPQNLFVPLSVLNGLRRGLYAKINPVQTCGKLPPLPEASSEERQPRFTIKVDNPEYLRLLNPDDFAEIICMLKPGDDTGFLHKLPKNKVRIALPAVCRRPAVYADKIRRLVDGGYNKWEAGNWWALELLPLEKIDLSFDYTLYALNSQAAAAAAETGADIITFSVEDSKINICNLIKKSPVKTSLVIYADVPLFTSEVCIKNNPCKGCDRKTLWLELEGRGRKYKALCADCATKVFDAKPFCIASTSADLKPDYFRMDFMNIPYTAEKVQNLVNKLLKFEDASSCINGNFINGNL